MIQLFGHKDNSHPLRNDFAYRGEAIRGLFNLCTYDDLHQLNQVECNAVVFVDLEYLSGNELTKLIELSAYFEEYGDLHIVNHPARYKNRYELLRLLFQKGINPHNVFLASEDYGQCSFPVFLRHRDFHTGALTHLLHDKEELDRQINFLNLTGHSVDDLLIVEYVDVADSNGLYQMFSAQKVGNTIVPKHTAISNSWMIKMNDNFKDYDKEMFDSEFLEFMTNFPHYQWVDEIFKIAGVEYGRLDYGLYNGKPVAWEINLNPDYVTGPGSSQQNEISKVKALNHADIREAFQEIAFGQVVKLDVPKRMLPSSEFGGSKVATDGLKKMLKSMLMKYPMLQRWGLKLRAFIQSRLS